MPGPPFFKKVSSEERRPMIRAAIALAKRGMAVFPCLPSNKLPMTEHGCKDATTDPETIEALFGERPDCNIAIATGSASGIFAVDVDGVDAEAELRRLEAEHGALPKTVEVISARGRHLYFKVPDLPVRNSASKIAVGIDVRGEGGYVLCPPSIHPSGKRYEWSVDSASAFAAAPKWLLDKITSPVNGSNPAMPLSDWRALVRDGVREGARDCTITKLTGYLLRRRLDPIIVLGLVQAWNAASCVPPLPAADVDRIVDSIAGRELARRTRGHDE